MLDELKCVGIIDIIKVRGSKRRKIKFKIPIKTIEKHLLNWNCYLVSWLIFKLWKIINYKGSNFIIFWEKFFEKYQIVRFWDFYQSLISLLNNTT